MRKFFKEFKAFISRGNILDLAVGVIIGGAFSAIVTALTNKILMPLINFAIGGAGGLAKARTILGTAVMDGENIDWTKTLYIDWGEFISAIINFLLIALVLFIILKVVMKSSQMLHSAKESLTAGKPTADERKEMKAQGLNPRDEQAVKTYREEKAKKEALLKAEEEAKQKALEEEKYKNSTEYLLKEILTTLKNEKPAKKSK